MNRFLNKNSRHSHEEAPPKLKESESEIWIRFFSPFLHVWPFQNLCEKLETSTSKGLTTEVVEKRLARYGKNKFLLPVPESKLHKYLKNCLYGFAIIILLSSIFCFLIYYLEILCYPEQDADREYIIAGFVLLIFLLLSGIYRYLQDNDDFAVVVAFHDLMPMYCTVIRDGRKQVILSENVVIGDILVVSFGQRLSADVRFFSAHGLELNNMALMGTSKPEIIDPVTYRNYIIWS